MTQKNQMIKKSLDLPHELHSRLLAIIEMNAGMTFTQVAISALEEWACSPKIKVRVPTSSLPPKKRRVK